ncbi:MAG: ABC transporter substrate-binding protein [Proteobacteria bacterium]|nr:ABC transporter substrate-binding protein [Pseudomonadota bacterium]
MQDVEGDPCEQLRRPPDSIMDRRTVIAIAASALLAAPLSAFPQRPTKVWHIGFLSGGARPADDALPAALQQALRDLGYVANKNVAYTGRWAEAQPERLPEMAAELVRLPVDLLLTSGAPAAQAAKDATSTIPIVFIAPGDAEGVGLITSMARPGGNITGITDLATELSAKRLEFLTQAVPSATHVAVIWNASDRAMTLRYREVEKAAGLLHITVHPLGVRRPEEIDNALATMTQVHPDAFFVVSDALTTINRQRILDFAASQHIPAMYEYGHYVRDGGLMSYGPSLDDEYRRAATYIDRILKGAQPGDLPVEQPTRYYFLFNRKTAERLDLAIPPQLQRRIDEVIQ